MELEAVSLDHDLELVVGQVDASVEVGVADHELRFDRQAGDVEGDGPEHRLEGVGRPRVSGRGDPPDSFSLSRGQAAGRELDLLRLESRAPGRVEHRQRLRERQVQAAVDDGAHRRGDPAVDDVGGVEAAPVNLHSVASVRRQVAARRDGDMGLVGHARYRPAVEQRGRGMRAPTGQP